MKSSIIFLITIIFFSFTIFNSYAEVPPPPFEEYLFGEDEYFLSESNSKKLHVKIFEGWEEKSTATNSCGTSYKKQITEKIGVNNEVAESFETTMGGKLGIPSLAEIGIEVTKNTKLTLTLSYETENTNEWEIDTPANSEVEWVLYQKYQKIIFDIFEIDWLGKENISHQEIFNFLSAFHTDQNIIPKYCGKQTDNSIPAWIKNTAGWWSKGQISDTDFIEGIQFLIINDFIKITDSDSDIPLGFESEVPEWIKITAGWWADGITSDNEFIFALQYLIEIEMIKV